MENKNKRLAKKSLIYFIGNLSSKILNFLLVPIYAYTISSTDLGNYDYIITLASIIIPIVYMVLWEAILKFSLSQKATIRRITTTTSIFTIILNIIIIPIMYIVFQYFYNIGVNAIYIVGIFVLYGLTNIWQYYARALKYEKVYVFSSIIATISNLIMNIIFICVLKMGFIGLAISYIVSNVIAIVVIEFKVKIISSIKLEDFDAKLLKNMIIFSAPLVLNTVSAWLLSGASRIIIINKLGSNANGIYTFANKFSVIVTLIGSVINMAFVEESIINSKSENVDNDFLKTVEFLLEKFLSLLILAIPTINIFYYMITSTEYYESKLYFPFLLIYSLFSVMATNIGTIFHVINKTKYAFFTTILGTIVFFLVAIIGIDKFGLICISNAQILGAFVIFISRYIYAKKYCRQGFDWKKIAIMLFFYIAISILCYNANLISNIIVFMILLVMISYTNKNIIINLYNKIVKKTDL